MSDNSKTLVLITGIGGFIASSIAVKFLEAGYRIRGTIRSEAKAKDWKAKHQKYADRIDIVVVPDIGAPGAFVEAAKGVEIFIHTASPLPAKDTSDSENAVLKPAINGTLEALKAAKNESSVKSFVLTSSCASVVKVLNPFDAAGEVYTEEDWNDAPYELAKTIDVPLLAYSISKALAEKAAWEFYKNEKPSFTFSTILPTSVYGPPENPLTPPNPIPGTNSFIVKNLLTKQPLAETSFIPPVDVRDVAEAHYLAATKTDISNGKRYIVTQTAAHPAEYIKRFKKWYPDLASYSTDVPDDFTPPGVFGFDGSKIVKELGLQLTPLDKTLKDTADFIIDYLEKSGGVPAGIEKIVAK